MRCIVLLFAAAICIFTVTTGARADDYDAALALDRARVQSQSPRDREIAQFDLALQKSFQLREGAKIVLGAEAYNLFNHPNFAVPSNTQSPLTLGGNGDAVFKDAAGNFANNVGRIFSTVGAGRQVQLMARFRF